MLTKHRIIRVIPLLQQICSDWMEQYFNGHNILVFGKNWAIIRLQIRNDQNRPFRPVIFDRKMAHQEGFVGVNMTFKLQRCQSYQSDNNNTVTS